MDANLYLRRALTFEVRGLARTPGPHGSGGVPNGLTIAASLGR